jgi:hypothetical protein
MTQMIDIALGVRCGQNSGTSAGTDKFIRVGTVFAGAGSSLKGCSPSPLRMELAGGRKGLVSSDRNDLWIGQAGEPAFAT